MKYDERFKDPSTLEASSKTATADLLNDEKFSGNFVLQNPQKRNLDLRKIKPYHPKRREKLNSPILQYSTIISNKYKTIDQIGAGAFGEIYSGIDLINHREVAIKVERTNAPNMSLKMEVVALKKLQKSEKVVRYLASGEEKDFNYLILERLGSNLAELKKSKKNGIFSMCECVEYGIQMIDALESIHGLGFIHRDIKPSNFCVGRVMEKGKHNIFLIDFNLARRFLLPNNNTIRPPRKKAGFRGTARYASINSHHQKELSRRDDLWSVFYVLVEFSLGSLPWRKVKDKKHIGDLKERFTNAELVKDLPPEFLLFMQHIQNLEYEDKPNYGYLREILCRIYNREHYNPEEEKAKKIREGNDILDFLEDGKPNSEKNEMKKNRNQERNIKTMHRNGSNSKKIAPDESDLGHQINMRLNEETDTSEIEQKNVAKCCLVM